MFFVYVVIFNFIIFVGCNEMWEKYFKKKCDLFMNVG